MKAILNLFVAIALVAAALVGCGKSTTPNTATTAGTTADNLAGLKEALLNFNKQEGHYPKTLDELVPKYIAKIPDAPGGYKYNYNPATGELKVSR